MKATSTLVEQDAQTRPASSIANVALADVEAPVGHLPSISVMSDDKEDWTMSDLAEAEEWERVGAKRHLCSFRESCRVKRRKALECVVCEAGLAEELVDNTVVVSPGVADVAGLLIDEFTGQLASTRVEVVSLTAKLYVLKKVQGKPKLEYKKVLKKVWAKKKVCEEHIGAERNGALSLYHGVLRSFLGVVRAAGERNAGHADTLTQLQFMSK